MAKRRYSDEEKAEALSVYDACGGNLREAARKLDMPWATLKQWVDGQGVHTVCADLRTQKKADLSDRLEAMAHKIVEALPGKISEATLQQATTALGIVVDKMQLLRNSPTAITENRELSEDERAGRIAELLQRGLDRQSGAGIDESRTAGIGSVDLPAFH